MWRSTLALTVLLTAAACNPTDNRDPAETTARRMQISGARSSSQLKPEQAAELTRAAEILLQTDLYPIKQAQAVLQSALKLSPASPRALTLAALVEISMIAEGGQELVEPLLSESKRIEMEAQVQQLRDHGRSDLAKFVSVLPAGLSPIKLYEDGRIYVQEHSLKRVENALEYLEKVRPPVVLNALERGQEERVVTCEEAELAPCFEVEATIKEKKITLELADFRVIKSYLKAMRIQLLLATSYKLEGYEALLEEVRTLRNNNSQGVPHELLLSAAQQKQGLLALDPANKLKEVKMQAEEIVNTALDLGAMEGLCGQDRLGKLIRQICLSDLEREQLQDTLLAIRGPSKIKLGQDSQGRPVNIVMNIGAFLQKPPKDLKVLLPTEIRPDGSLVIPRTDLNGLFPNKDLVDKINALRR